MKCPNCGAAAADGAAECAFCGLLFAKWREREEKEKREAAEALTALEAAAPPARNPWIGRAIALGLVIAWILGLAVYYAQRLPGIANGSGAR